MAWNAGPGVLHAGRQNSDRAGGRAGVGGGPAWKKLGKADSRMVGDIAYEQEDYAARLAYEEQQADAGLWQGRGVGRGPLWPEGGGKGDFMKNMGWREGEKESAPNILQAHSSDGGLSDCTATLQVFKFGEGDAKRLGKDVAIKHRSAIGRDPGIPYL